MKRPDVCRFACEMTSFDFALLEMIDPWGEERDDIRAGLQSTVTAACSGVKRPKVSDYVLKFERREKKRNQDLARFAKRMERLK